MSAESADRRHGHWNSSRRTFPPSPAAVALVVGGRGDRLDRELPVRDHPGLHPAGRHARRAGRRLDLRERRRAVRESRSGSGGDPTR